MTFIVVGVIAGLVFGIYLSHVGQVSQLIFVDGPSLSLVTEKSSFDKGEHIKIQLINSGTVPLVFSDSSFGLRITGLSGMLMYTPMATDAETRLEPGRGVEFVWNQLKYDQSQARGGIYKIHAGGVDLEGNNVEKSITVTVR